MVRCRIGDAFQTTFMIDSGADVNVIAENAWEEIHDLYERNEIAIYDYKHKPNKKVLAFASSEPLSLIASFSAWTEAAKETKPRNFAKFLVVKGGEKSIIGRKTAVAMKLLQFGDSINNITAEKSEPAKDEHPFPKIPNERVTFDVDPNVAPTRNAYYHIPAAFSERASDRLKKMARQQIIEKVTKAPRWISGMSAVPKGAFDFRLVVNMKGPNRAIRRCYHRMPHLDEIQRKLHGAKVFSKLDLVSAFHHVELEENSRELTTFMAEDGMYRFTRLVFGVNCAPEKFQEIMERILRGIEGIIIFIDDILIFARNQEELTERTNKVLLKLKENNLTINKEKCQFAKSSITFLGHELTAEGLNINKTKIKAVESFREPRTSSELKSFLGLASYVSSFIPRFGDLTHVLWKTASTKPFQWSDKAQDAFQQTKKAIINCTTTNGYFSDTDEIVLFTDASPFALGAVLTQNDSEGRERVISFASKALTKTEQRYPQTQREALGIVWAVEHFHYYLRGRHFKIKTDARGVAFIFNRDRESRKRIMSRAQGFALRLNEFSYEIEYVSGNFNIADTPSRLYEGIDEEYTEREGPWEIGNLQCNEENFEHNKEQITCRELKESTSSDETLLKVMGAIESNEWPREIQNYKSVRDDLYPMNGLLMKAGAIVIPQKDRVRVLKIAHTGHPGATAMRSILRERVWWPSMDRETCEFVESCKSCTLTSRNNPPVPMARSDLPAAPWDLVAIDYNGPYARHNGISILLMVDCYSRFLLASIVKSTDFRSLEHVLESSFQRYGYPKTIKSDNGPPFNGKQYADYCEAHGIERIHSTPLFPQQNGTIERYMQLVNKAMQIAENDSKEYMQSLAETIRAHNCAKHRVTAISPEELMYNRKIRRALPLVGETTVTHESLNIKTRDSREKILAKNREDKKRGAKDTKLNVGDTAVIMRNIRSKGESRFDPTPWKIIDKKRGDLELEAADGRRTKRNVTMVKKIVSPTDDPSAPTRELEATSPLNCNKQSNQQELRRSTRSRKTPPHLDMYIRLLRGEIF